MTSKKQPLGFQLDSFEIMRDDRERIENIREAINKIEKQSVLGKDEFFGDELIQSWILLQLQTIGEAARAMSDQTYTKYPEIA